MDTPKITYGFDRGDCTLAFADTVRVRSTPITEGAGVAAATGMVMGETTPSVTGKTVIGTPRRDYAVLVSIKGRDFWFDPDLLEFVDHSPGTTLSLSKGPAWKRNGDGQWKKLGLVGRFKEWLSRRK